MRLHGLAQSLFVLHWFVSCRVAPGTGCARLKHSHSSKTPRFLFRRNSFVFILAGNRGLDFPRAGFLRDAISKI
ncbi:hypothetical protein BN940_05876 [Castellaniella defragrans 65Phen]|uniref:Uncharacterized protein n=1 Tax=Castellaniella defragrans (strain DSM 12143 / CCUG 39792 / 65Phen) TaxID=1437824 RepID=W8WVT8_CASD6|nr:hypothetical protein BN940_05876 [Castellaniella defragrans 65Phen]